MFRVAIDTGGTFTDYASVDEQGRFKMVKIPTDRQNPSEGIVEGLHRLAEAWGMSLQSFLGQTTQLVHGTTLSLNALIERKGVPTALLTTKGFRDALELGRSRLANQWDLRAKQPLVLIPRYHRIGITERVDYKGDIVTPLDLDEVRSVALELKNQGIQAVAVNFLFSFQNQRHEQEAARELSAFHPELFISRSSEVAPRIGEYERTSTTVLNAYLTPVLANYLTSLEEKLSSYGWTGPVNLMLNSGGTADIPVVKNCAVKTLMSGPAGGVKGAQVLSRLLGKPNLVVADMGGTSFDVSLIVDGKSKVTSEAEVEGYPVTTPMLEIYSTGAGGGSIAAVDMGGNLRVGPDSAGSCPGPACYGRGGSLPTVTDAVLLLGLVNPQSFLGGKLPLMTKQAEIAIGKYLAEPLGIEMEEAALAVYRVAAAKMADAVRLLTVRQGLDPRRFALVAAGGAFPLFAGLIAKELAMPEVIIPLQGPVFCAWGMLGATCQSDVVQSCLTNQDSFDLTELTGRLKQLREQAGRELIRQGVMEQRWTEEINLEMRYIGQHHEIAVPVSLSRLAGGVDEISELFHGRHRDLYGYAEPDKPWEIVNLRYAIREQEGVAFLPSFNSDQDNSTTDVTVHHTLAKPGQETPEEFRQIRLDLDCPITAKIFSANSLSEVMVGPALIEFPYTTVLIPPGFRAAVKTEGYISLSQEEVIDENYAR